MESSIRRRLISNENLCALLTKFGDETAIFYQKAPADTDSETLYPHVVFTVDKYADATRGTAGLLNVDIITSQLTTPPEEIECLIRETLEGVFFRPQIGEIFSLKWQRTDVFTEPASERTPFIIGATMTFEIYEWVSAETSDPDPIQGLNVWASMLDDLAIIGATEFEEIYEPTRELPALYFDVQKTKLVEQTNSAVWLDVTITLHVFAPDVRSRREWLTALNQRLLLAGAIILADDSPMRLLESEYLTAASEVQGQIRYVFRYALQRKIPYAHTLMNRGVDFSKELRWQEKIKTAR